MKDPFSDLLKSLQAVFHLEAKRNGKFIYPEVQQLKEATERYNPAIKHTFTALLDAIEKSIHHIEKWRWRINFNSIKHSMDNLAKIHQMPTIDWNKVLSHPKVSLTFQFNPSAQDPDLSTWLSAKTRRPFFQLEPKEVIQALIDNSDGPLIDNNDRRIFSQKLSAHLKKYPDFLFHLIMGSEKNFSKICRSRLIFYLTDEQIAKAIIKHIPAFVHKRGEPFEQVDDLIRTLNDRLSNGRSISTLLRNAEARPILFNSTFFQIYQSDSYKNRQTLATPSVSHRESELLKPDL
ncbi:hypothetical protein [Legionella maioricensis]|uniref:hypothetical protein n=1 Tax=Legionella maioricensis TaxID=2896528 RepID=UPI0025408363|nr:hypothetical protein [Legionella maioricensis]